ncbi:MAG: ribonuclease J [Parcubacteria group bacterium]|nr:ribonuclease J [Parcubacteria group bacterium]
MIMIKKQPIRPSHLGGLNYPIRIIPLGGFEEIGLNMMIIEYNGKMIIVDMGLGFPEEDMPGIDFIIPNIAYLKGKEKNILGVFITHGHYDHIGAIPYLIEKLGNPPIFTMPLTAGFILKRQEDFPGVPKLEIHRLKKDEVVHLGSFKVGYFRVNHNIPDGIGLVINTPVGKIVHSCDFKFDYTPINDEPIDEKKLKAIGESNVLALLSDSTNAENPGHSLSESVVLENMDQMFQKAKGRIITATFASLISRIQIIFMLAEKYGRKVAIDGYSMKANVAIARELKYLKFSSETLIKPEEVDKFSDNKIVVLGTGAQGEGNAVLMRIASGEHRFIQIKKGDTVIFSSSVVPGNERTVQRLKDTLYRRGAKVYHYKMMDLHAGGHGQQEDLRQMLELIRPKYFIPIHGNYYMLKLHGEIAESVGIKPENIIIAGDGDAIELLSGKVEVVKEKAPAGYVMVDGLGVGDVGEVVLRDRQVMAQDGMFVVIVIVDSKTGKIRGDPDVISRGFVYLKESRALIGEAKSKVKKIVSKAASPEHTMNWAYVRDQIRERLGQFLFSKTERRPMILPVVIEI